MNPPPLPVDPFQTPTAPLQRMSGERRGQGSYIFAIAVSIISLAGARFFHTVVGVFVEIVDNMTTGPTGYDLGALLVRGRGWFPSALLVILPILILLASVLKKPRLAMILSILTILLLGLSFMVIPVTIQENLSKIITEIKR